MENNNNNNMDKIINLDGEWNNMVTELLSEAKKPEVKEVTPVVKGK